MAVIIGSLAGFGFALLALIFARMGAHVLFPLGYAAPQPGVTEMIPLIGDVQAEGVLMIALGWFVATFLGAYVADLIARTVRAGWFVTGMMLGLAIGVALRGAPPAMVLASMMFVLGAGYAADRRSCRASRAERKRRREAPAPSPVLRRAEGAPPLPGLA
ncbi:hypothetical protein PQ455_14575 [Sphingomonas naphthae]|uniref:MFS transporter n=1 Tax=Sphingomonas naphthae TaxID=1813468 RepID=A0ABY7TKE3_9SPHN|nr:hypothetical protein [Sphingomonas naphthae]WCT72850.1 hypothetical protein PQ455_14575 [Sphingomonas naphthae]